MPRTSEASVGPSQGRRHRIGAYVGLGVLALLLFPVSATGLVAPTWALWALEAVWVLLFALGLRWFTSHPGRVALLPLAMVVIWFAALYTGETFLGWTA